MPHGELQIADITMYNVFFVIQALIVHSKGLRRFPYMSKPTVKISLAGLFNELTSFRSME
jgi:hypothetical protein